MATFKVAIRLTELWSDGTANVKIRVSHDRVVRYIATEYFVLPEFFDESTGTIKPGGAYNKDQADRANGKLQIKIGVLAAKVDRQKNIQSMDMASLMAFLRDKRAEYELFSLLDARIG